MLNKVKSINQSINMNSRHTRLTKHDTSRQPNIF